MTDIKILKGMLNNEVATGISDMQERQNVTLKEDNKGGPFYKIEIEGLPNACFIFKADKKSQIGMLRSAKGECRRVDYVVVISDGLDKRIFYIELKKREYLEENEESLENLEKQIIQKMKGTKCLIEYCKAIANVFWQDEGGDNFLEGYDEDYVLVKCLQNPPRSPIVRKQSDDSRDEARPNSPDNPKIISVFESLDYNELAA